MGAVSYSISKSEQVYTLKKGKDSNTVTKAVEELVEKTSADFAMEIYTGTGNYPCGLEVANLTYPEIAVPNELALESRAEKYREKYKIPIFVSQLSKLSTFLTSFPANERPEYVGVLITQDDHEVRSKGHVLPLLCHFCKNGEIEFLMMDSVGESLPFFSNVENYLVSKGYAKENIYRTVKSRQVDAKSCRTGAITLLRNALLHLKHENKNLNFDTLCSSAEQKAKRAVDYLPLEWDFTEQITNKNPEGDSEKSLVIRDLFSKKESKRKKPRTVKEFREKYIEEVTFSKKFNFIASMEFASVYKEQDSLNGVEMEFTALPRSGEYECSLSLKTTQPINAYLVKKGFRNKLPTN